MLYISLVTLRIHFTTSKREKWHVFVNVSFLFAESSNQFIFFFV